MPPNISSPLTHHVSAARHCAPPTRAKRLIASTSSRRLPRNETSDGSSGVVNLGQRSAGRVAARDEAGNAIGREPGPLYREWLASTGAQFKDPRPHETNYLGGSTPFPLNPTFKPPPPLSDRLRNIIFSEWVKNPSQNNPRALSLRYGVSIKRVEAIIRLKVHEHKWKQEGKPLQTAFLEAFESATGVYKGVPAHKLRSRAPPELTLEDYSESPRANAAAADYDADWEQLPTQDIARIYWEPIDETAKDPVVPVKLKEVAEKELASTRSHPPPASIKKVGRATFVDVGDKFWHTNVHVKRTDPRYRGPLWKPSFSEDV